VGAQGRRRLPGAGRGAPVSLTEDRRKQLSDMDATHIEAIFRREYGRTAAQDAFARALRVWPQQGMPPTPVGWPPEADHSAHEYGLSATRKKNPAGWAGRVSAVLPFRSSTMNAPEFPQRRS
jgi:predicted RNA polymerase sigma factor